MNEKTIKRYLMRYINAENKHIRLYEAYCAIIETIAGLGGYSYGLRVQATASNSAKFERLIERREAVFEKLIKAGVEAAEIKADLIIKINALENARDKWILTEKYVNRVPWNDLFNHGERSERTYYEWHRAALMAFGEIWEEAINASC